MIDKKKSCITDTTKSSITKLLAMGSSEQDIRNFFNEYDNIELQCYISDQIKMELGTHEQNTK